MRNLNSIGYLDASSRFPVLSACKKAGFAVGRRGSSIRAVASCILRRVSEVADSSQANLDWKTVEHFGQEWSRFPQKDGWQRGEGLRKAFERYCAPLPPGSFHPQAVVGDFGAGSGRWAGLVAPDVHHLFLLEPSPEAMRVARSNMSGYANVTFVQEPIGGPSIPRASLDVAYSLGVIHHIPDPVQALRDVRTTLKPGGLFLGYLYYALDNRPAWYRVAWRTSDRIRKLVSRMSKCSKRVVADIAAAVLYWPLARFARIVGILGGTTTLIPLSQYADKSYYVMRNDALDRFGTPLEQRFTQAQIAAMLETAGFELSTLSFSPREPFWCFTVRNVLDAPNGDGDGTSMIG